MQDINKKSFDTLLEIAGIKVEKETVIDDVTKEQKEQDIEKVAFGIKGNKTDEIKDATTKVDVNVDKTEWTNEKQNEVNFVATLDSTQIKYDLFKNPTIKIELPSQVEKVVLEESNIIYGNGLTLTNVEQKTEKGGNISIYATLEGTQTAYDESNLGLATTLTIPAKIILKKDIEDVNEKINITYTNEYNTENGQGEIEKLVKIVNYNSNEEKTNDEQNNYTKVTDQIETKIDKVVQEVAEQATAQQTEGIKLNVTTTKGSKTLQDGDTVYPGEFIKYSISVKNTTNSEIENVKVIGDIPEGTKYGELESQFGYIRTEGMKI